MILKTYSQFRFALGNKRGYKSIFFSSILVIVVEKYSNIKETRARLRARVWSARLLLLCQELGFDR